MSVGGFEPDDRALRADPPGSSGEGLPTLKDNFETIKSFIYCFVCLTQLNTLLLRLAFDAVPVKLWDHISEAIVSPRCHSVHVSPSHTDPASDRGPESSLPVSVSPMLLP